MHTVEHTCDVFLARIVYVTDCDGKELDKFVHDEYAITESLAFGDSVGGCVIIDYIEDEEDRKVFLIWVEDKEDICTLVHELLHLVCKIFDYKGVAFDKNNEETIAYYLEHWLKKFMAKPVAKKKKQRKVVKKG